MEVPTGKFGHTGFAGVFPNDDMWVDVNVLLGPNLPQFTMVNETQGWVVSTIYQLPAGIPPVSGQVAEWTVERPPPSSPADPIPPLAKFDTATMSNMWLLGTDGSFLELANVDEQPNVVNPFIWNIDLQSNDVTPGRIICKAERSGPSSAKYIWQGFE
jgi:hypothetical protein